MSLELQREFGLRREEAMKIQPSFADCIFRPKLNTDSGLR